VLYINHTSTEVPTLNKNLEPTLQREAMVITNLFKSDIVNIAGVGELGSCFIFIIFYQGYLVIIQVIVTIILEHTVSTLRGASLGWTVSTRESEVTTNASTLLECLCEHFIFPDVIVSD